MGSEGRSRLFRAFQVWGWVGLAARSGDEFQIKEFGENLVSKNVPCRQNKFPALCVLQNAFFSKCQFGTFPKLDLELEI